MLDTDHIMFPDVGDNGEEPKGKTSKAFAFGDVVELAPIRTRTLLIDADMLVYQACFTTEGKPFDEAITVFNQKLADIMYNAQGAHYELLLTSADKSNFRFALAKTKPYKENRKDKEKPKHYTAFRKWLVRQRGAEIVYGEEADDQMSIRQMRAIGRHIYDQQHEHGTNREAAIDYLRDVPELYEHTCICTDDKDLDMVPGWHYRLRTGETYFVSDPGEVYIDHKAKLHGRGYMMFAAQLLIGDATDNIPGLGYGADPVLLNEFKVANGMRRGRGFGPAGAVALIGGCNWLEAMYRVKCAYEHVHPSTWRTRLMEVARLLWMRRYVNEMYTFPSEVVAYIKERSSKEE